ncbi:hypothetical protein LOK49_LG11G01252 [Camellia lanceoleosa]|uniref:Uncharacterized protein n=1 Tax=Camellia lanceoleosa TaxID=1840588 RepID=A0ACC0G1V3_9ERIC|nr:hypothetical protein LOK49_LG11G01252 [Camellia lanceoleosa]
MMSRKRDKPYTSRHVPYSFPKRRRPLPPPHPSSPSATSDDCHQNSASKSPSTVQVTWATDDVPRHKDSTDSFSSSSSKLVRAEVPLSRHGRGFVRRRWKWQTNVFNICPRCIFV